MNGEVNIDELISKLTLEEKAGLCSGRDYWTTKPVARLGIPTVRMSDGPHGLRLEMEDNDKSMNESYPATAFPPAATFASSWDVSIAGQMGEEIAIQCLDQDVSVILGPGVNIKRSPLCGRNFEYLSEDPYLSSRMCVGYVGGVQKHNVGVSVKHFCANNQESRRMTINAVVDERALREIYMPAFESAVKEAQPWTIMCSYNRVNGEYASDNKRLLTDILRNEWGFKGIVVSDWNATNNRVQGVKAGLDLEMPYSGGLTDKHIVKAVKNGELAEEELDKVVRRVLEFVYKCASNQYSGVEADYERGHKLARHIAESSAVLLKNEGKALPLSDDEDIALIGELARTSRYQGSGSSRINPYKLVSLTEAMTAEGKKFAFEPGYTTDNANPDDDLITRAVELAKTKKTVVAAIGLTEDYECEGYDRSHIDLPEAQNRLLSALTKVCDNVIVVLYGGSPVAMPWIGDVKAVLNAYLPGEAGGEAVCRLLYGKVNPSGKLAETYPLSLDDYLASKYFGMGPKVVEHRESIFVGYRYYDSAEKEVLFPFGYGLSYTTFEYSNLKIDGAKVSFTVTNTGDMDGAEVCQLYVGARNSRVFRAKKELKRFVKVFLKKGQSTDVTFTLDDRCFAFYNTEINDWYVENCDYEIMVGASSRDIRLSGTIRISGRAVAPMPDYVSKCPSYYGIGEVGSISDEEFTRLYGKKLPSNEPSRRGEFDLTTTLGELSCCLIGKIIIKVAPSVIKGQVENPDMTTMLMLMQGMRELPLRGLIGISGGIADIKVIRGMMEWGNRHRLKGLFLLIGGLFATLGNISRQKVEKALKRDERKAAREEAAKAKAEAKALAAEEEARAKAEKAARKEEAKAEKAARKEEAKASSPTMRERFSSFFSSDEKKDDSEKKDRQ